MKHVTCGVVLLVERRKYTCSFAVRRSWSVWRGGEGCMQLEQGMSDRNVV